MRSRTLGHPELQDDNVRQSSGVAEFSGTRRQSDEIWSEAVTRPAQCAQGRSPYKNTSRKPALYGPLSFLLLRSLTARPEAHRNDLSFPERQRRVGTDVGAAIEVVAARCTVHLNLVSVGGIGSEPTLSPNVFLVF